MNTALPTKEVSPRGARIAAWIDDPKNRQPECWVYHTHMFLEAAVRLRESMKGRPPAQDALRFLLGCEVSRDSCPHGLAVLTAAALTSDRPETPHEPWLSEIREGFGQTVASLVEAVTIRHDYREPTMRLAVLRATGREGALAQILRVAHVTAKFSRTLAVVREDDCFPQFAREMGQIGSLREDVFGEGPFITTVPPETLGFAPGFNRVIEIAINVRNDLLGLLEQPEPVPA